MSESETHALEIRGLCKTYGNGRQALKGIDLTVRPGDFFALLGPNGAGKSTTIGIVTGLVNKTAGTSLSQSLEMQFQLERAVKDMPEVKTYFSRVGTAEVATDPMPPNISDGYVMLKERKDWPDPDKSKAALLEELEQRLQANPGNAFEISQPMQLRFNELISGVRSDLGIKVYGDNLKQLLRTGNEIAKVLNGVQAAGLARAVSHGLPARARHGVQQHNTQGVLLVKLVKAFIHHVRTPDVVQALADAGYRNLTLHDVKGMLKPINENERDYSREGGALAISEVRLSLVCDIGSRRRRCEMNQPLPS